MERHPDDNELDFLYNCSNEELDPLVKVLLDAATNFLDVDANYKAYHPDHSKYVGAIIADLQLFGGNSVVNLFRGHGVPYREILTDVCDKQDVSYSSSDSTEEIEKALLEKSLKSLWSKMTEEQRREVLEELGGGSVDIGGASASALIALFRMGGFGTYKIMLLLVNSLASMLIGRGLTLGANALLTRSLSIVTGPIGWTIGGVWALFDIASPAMRVTVPATVYVAALRGMKNTEKYAKEIGKKVEDSLKKGRFSRAKIFG